MNNLKIKYLLTITFFTLVLVSCEKKTDDVSGDGDIKISGDDRSVGLRPTPEATLSGLPTASVPPASGTLPSSKMLSFPPSANQGTEGSCVAFATAYGVMSYIKGGSFYDNAGSINKQAVYSPEYVYNQVIYSSGDCGSGSYFVTYNGKIGALNLLTQKGVCNWSTMPYSDVNGCITQPNSTQDAEAQNNKLLSFERVVNLNSSYLKSLIYQGFPIIIGAYVDDGFKSANSTFVWNSSTGNTGDYHAMVLTGYDDNKSAFRLFNSWGQDWGDDGSTWISYDFVEDVVYEAYIAYPDTTQNNNNNNNTSSCSSGATGNVTMINDGYTRIYVVFDEMPLNIPYYYVRQLDTVTTVGICTGLRSYSVFQSTINMDPGDIIASNTFYVNEDSTTVLNITH